MRKKSDGLLNPPRHSPCYGSFGLVRASKRKSGLGRNFDASIQRAKTAAVGVPALPALALLEPGGALNGNGSVLWHHNGEKTNSA